MVQKIAKEMIRQARQEGAQDITSFLRLLAMSFI